MQFREGSPVYAWDDKDVGRIARVVLNPVTKKVTHVVVRQGFLFTEDKVVPIGLFLTASEDRAILRKDVGNLDDLPRFEEKHYVPVDPSDEAGLPPEVAHGLLWYPPIGMAPYETMAIYGAPTVFVHRGGDSDVPYREHTEQNIPDHTVALNEGARVISADGEHVGDVERVFVDPESSFATHIVISQGLLLKSRKMVPTLWLSTVGEDEIHLTVNRDFVDALPDYDTA